MCQANRGKLTFLQGSGGLRICIYVHGLLRVSRVSNQTVHNMDYFSRSNTEKNLGCGLVH